MTLRGWRMLAENHWRTFGEKSWRSVGENTWRTMGENLWRIIARKLTARITDQPGELGPPGFQHLFTAAGFEVPVVGLMKGD